MCLWTFRLFSCCCERADKLLVAHNNADEVPGYFGDLKCYSIEEGLEIISWMALITHYQAILFTFDTTQPLPVPLK